MEPHSSATAADYGWYFAYGSNLSKTRIERRTGVLPFAQPACLQHYRLAFNLHADGAIYANIVPARQGVVWGAAYWCSRAMMTALDRYEGVEFGCYHRAVVEIETGAGARLLAEAYLGGDHFVAADGRPGDDYLKLIVTGAGEHGLSEEYIRLITICARPLSTG